MIMKKVLSLFLSVLMLTSVVAAVDLSAYAASGSITKVAAGTNVSFTGGADDETKVDVAVSVLGEDYPVGEIDVQDAVDVSFNYSGVNSDCTLTASGSDVTFGVTDFTFTYEPTIVITEELITGVLDQLGLGSFVSLLPSLGLELPIVINSEGGYITDTTANAKYTVTAVATDGTVYTFDVGSGNNATFTCAGLPGGDYKVTVAYDIDLGFIYDYYIEVLGIGISAADTVETARTISDSDTFTLSVSGAVTQCKTHTWDSGKTTTKATCAKTGVKTYTCKVCGATKTEKIAKKAHTWEVTTKASATNKKNGKFTCSVCKATKKLYYPKTMTLSTTSYTYNAKAKKPTVTIKDSNGSKISSKYYKVTYINQSTGKTVSSMKNPGKYYVKVTFKTRYSGSLQKAVTIKPKKTSIKSVKASSKGFTVKWGKVSTQNTGYQVQYSTSKSFKSAKTATISKTGTTSKKVTKLKAKKKYYVRVRTYKTVKINGKNTKIYSSWSSVKGVTTKK